MWRNCNYRYQLLISNVRVFSAKSYQETRIVMELIRQYVGGSRNTVTETSATRNRVTSMSVRLCKLLKWSTLWLITIHWKTESVRFGGLLTFRRLLNIWTQLLNIWKHSFKQMSFAYLFSFHGNYCMWNYLIICVATKMPTKTRQTGIPE